jgi:N utilization substance protein B
MGSRRRGRQRAVQILYEWAITERPIDVIMERFWRVHADAEEVRTFAEALARGASAGADHIDQLIGHQSDNWRLDRLSNVDRSILRLGVYEILNQPDTPAAVVIDEAVELGKRFSGPEAGQFVNGILDGIRKRLEASPAAVRAGADDEDEA